MLEIKTWVEGPKETYSKSNKIEIDDDEYAPVANAKDLRNQSKSLHRKSEEYSDPSFTERIYNMYSDM